MRRTNPDNTRLTAHTSARCARRGLRTETFPAHKAGHYNDFYALINSRNQHGRKEAALRLMPPPSNPRADGAGGPPLQDPTSVSPHHPPPPRLSFRTSGSLHFGRSGFFNRFILINFGFINGSPPSQCKSVVFTENIRRIFPLASLQKNTLFRCTDLPCV